MLCMGIYIWVVCLFICGSFVSRRLVCAMTAAALAATTIARVVSACVVHACVYVCCVVCMLRLLLSGHNTRSVRTLCKKHSDWNKNVSVRGGCCTVEPSLPQSLRMTVWVEARYTRKFTRGFCSISSLSLSVMLLCNEIEMCDIILVCGGHAQHTFEPNG